MQKRRAWRVASRHETQPVGDELPDALQIELIVRVTERALWEESKEPRYLLFWFEILAKFLSQERPQRVRQGVASHFDIPEFPYKRRSKCVRDIELQATKEESSCELTI